VSKKHLVTTCGIQTTTSSSIAAEKRPTHEITRSTKRVEQPLRKLKLVRGLGVGVGMAPALEPVLTPYADVTASLVIVAAPDRGLAPVASPPALHTARIMTTVATGQAAMCVMVAPKAKVTVPILAMKPSKRVGGAEGGSRRLTTQCELPRPAPRARRRVLRLSPDHRHPLARMMIILARGCHQKRPP